MARTRFLQGLDDLRARLLRMGGLAEQAVDRACQAYIERDLTRCRMVLEGETQINIAEREIDELAFDLLAMQQPMAVDLRFILAVTKINADLERVGDQAVNIALGDVDLGFAFEHHATARKVALDIGLAGTVHGLLGQSAHTEQTCPEIVQSLQERGTVRRIQTCL